MLKNLYWTYGLVILIGMFLSCRYPSPHPIEGGPDTTVPNKPDTVIIDTIPAKNPDSSLADIARFGSVDTIFTYSNLRISKGIFGKATDYKGKATDLSFEFVAPAKDTLKYRPFVLMVHEGAFIFGDLNSEMAMARGLARRGYAAASINYRLGFNGGTATFACGGTGTDAVKAVYRAVQDTYSAIHYFVDHAEELGIDTRQIMLAGSSAGAITVSALVYMNEADFEALAPGITKALGRLDPQAENSPFRVRALLTQMGYGLFRGEYINASNAMPTVFFQRVGDNVLPYYGGTFLSCPGYPGMVGAKVGADQLRKFKIPFELNYENLEGHHLSYPGEYIVTRYAGFMKRLWSQNPRQITNNAYKTVEDVKLP
ncbi:Carboxylesterase family protein [Dyadobacter soli]|uniref:Carboxylesterase family protein n=1 Tax=Dyadobacter soli TaxID=659014 RepID=A0A1G7A7P2_9BACT|nr:alpha/beta hydrolase [Dyadobacter soli]SDE09896.1 Carboxylesterase family protein [Dyadobacter soli]